MDENNYRWNFMEAMDENKRDGWNYEDPHASGL